MRGTWVAQLVKHLTLGFSSGLDLMVCGFEPHVRLCTGYEACLGSSLSLSLSLSLKVKNKLKKNGLLSYPKLSSNLAMLVMSCATLGD